MPSSLQGRPLDISAVISTANVTTSIKILLPLYGLTSLTYDLTGSAGTVAATIIYANGSLSTPTIYPASNGRRLLGTLTGGSRAAHARHLLDAVANPDLCSKMQRFAAVVYSTLTLVGGSTGVPATGACLAVIAVPGQLLGFSDSPALECDAPLCCESQKAKSLHFAMC